MSSRYCSSQGANRATRLVVRALQIWYNGEMATSAAIRRLATNPQAFVRWQTTGRLPRGEKPEGALIALLQAISPRDRIALRGVMVDRALGYNGSRQFGSAEQALRWAAPEAEVFGSFPAKSWQVRTVVRLTLDDLLAKTASAPHGIRERYPHLCSKVVPGAVTGVVADEGPHSPQPSM